MVYVSLINCLDITESSNSLTVCKLVEHRASYVHTSSVQPLLLTHTIKVNSDLMWNAFVHGHCIISALD